ncbi:DEKNAAC103303 [Brettanomyces naardenensis]|uniref:Nucleolar protein 12 n=1 Tax=Brettanomyces naardenensis TaxID=13370 RepID=A0A448YN28_BRENA|nr:DEKNAAC103303 [Brettanomyces naardenensis]
MSDSISGLFGGSAPKDENVSSLFSKSSKIDNKKLINEKRHVIEGRRDEESDEGDAGSDGEVNEGDREVPTGSTGSTVPTGKSTRRDRKLGARKVDDREVDDPSLEDRYLSKLVRDESEDEAEEGAEGAVGAEDDITEERSSPQTSTLPQPNLKSSELSKAERTIFVGNVPAEVMEDKKSIKKFKKVFSEYVKSDPKLEIQPIESIRFRSLHTDSNAPRRAAFITKQIEEGGVVNSYIVFKKEEDSLKALALNGHVYLNHHLRIDHLTHPTKHENKQCIFVGNLDFEEDEESLWGYFNDKLREEGDDEGSIVTNVRMVRDSKTNFGKGFAIVQFRDVNYVEKALLLNGKKLSNSKKGRKIRIARCKSMKKVEDRGEKRKRRARNYLEGGLTDKQRSLIGRARKVLGKRDRREAGIVIEGERAKEGSKVEIGKKRRRKANA